MQKDQPPAPPAPATDTVGALGGLSARLRISEQRYSELRKKMLFVEQNMLLNHKRAMREIKKINEDINEIKRTIQAIEDKIITIIKEIRLLARKEDINVMKKYIELWSPVDFVRREQLDKIIEEKLQERFGVGKKEEQ
ncbi:hypothetical protein D6825_04035 [Candidatus Woesearchaeota archaeon]|nr:MAG: hypothetical protein D6825_04035 [Candidatus Woesearchaeota archaeon]